MLLPQGSHCVLRHVLGFLFSQAQTPRCPNFLADQIQGALPGNEGLSFEDINIHSKERHCELLERNIWVYRPSVPIA